MSYSIYLYRHNVVGYVGADGYSDADFRAIEEVLKRWGWDGYEEYPALETPEGHRVEISGKLAPGQFDCLILTIWHLDAEICELALEIAQAGRLMITHDGDEFNPILIDDVQRLDLPPECAGNRNLLICTTPGQLEAAIGEGFRKWKGYKASLGM